MLTAGLSGLIKGLSKKSSTSSTASMVSHVILTVESFYIAVLPVPVSTRHTGEVQLIQ